MVQPQKRTKLPVRRAQKSAEKVIEKVKVRIEIVSEKGQRKEGMETGPSEEEEIKILLRRSIRSKRQTGDEDQMRNEPMREPTKTALVSSETRNTEIEVILEGYKDIQETDKEEQVQERQKEVDEEEEEYQRKEDTTMEEADGEEDEADERYQRERKRKESFQQGQ